MCYSKTKSNFEVQFYDRDNCYQVLRHSGPVSSNGTNLVTRNEALTKFYDDVFVKTFICKWRICGFKKSNDFQMNSTDVPCGTVKRVSQ